MEEQYFEDHVQHFVRQQTGSTDMITDWVVVCATVDAITGEPTGFTYSANSASAQYVRLGLLQAAVNDINNLSIVDVIRQARRRPPRSDQA